MNIESLSLKELHDAIVSQKISSESVVKYYKDKCQKSDLNAVLEVYDDVILQAQKIDQKIKNGEKVGRLAGIPIAIKDNILYYGKKMTCASKFLKDYISPYNSTVTKKLLEEDAIIFARTNMDEFAMGGSCENSCYGPCKNAFDPTRVSGGSSGGSASAVAAGLCHAALGTDTGGSIRQPSSFNGVVGIKPTYGTVSRYGIVAFASSTDQASPITRSVSDNEYLLKIIAGEDEHDQTSIKNNFDSRPIKQKYKIGVIKELLDDIKQLKEYKKFENALNKLKREGHEIVTVSIEHIKNTLACYYIITPAEATSNLARFDGIKYTTRADDCKTLEEVYIKSRSQGFGKEVKRRIMLGNFVLSSGFFDAYYKKAKKLKTLLLKEFSLAFNSCDVILTPTTPGEAFKIGGKIDDPVSMYIEDLFTVPASLAGIPALSVPFDKGENGLPLGMQIMGPEKSENALYDFAKKFERLGG